MIKMLIVAIITFCIVALVFTAFKRGIVKKYFTDIVKSVMILIVTACVLTTVVLLF